MLKFNRAERRRQIARLKKNRRNYWGFYRDTSPGSGPTPRQLGFLSQNPCSCSCPTCSYDRRCFGRTIQEISFLQDKLYE